MTRADDIRFLRRAMALAARAEARNVSPNPRVGCVIVIGGRVIGEGTHSRFGAPHAEALALKKVGPKAKGATAYTTLEPCANFAGKKTPSCAQALLDAGVRRVVFPSLDPHPKISGRGAALLRRAGVRVDLIGSLQGEAEALNRGFFSRMRRNRPWVILKTALSLDGKASATSGRSRWITGPKARAAVHDLRAGMDAVAVGAGTVIADDPALTAHGAGPDPLRVVFAGRRSLPTNARIFDGTVSTVVYRIKKPRDLRGALRDLSANGIGTLLLEGGPKLHASFLRAGFIDEVRVFLAPKLLSGATDPNRAPRLRASRWEKLGDDWLVSGTL